MYELRTTLKGFGPFVTETVVDWGKLGSLIAITAPNGSGKTFLIEAIIAVLYGRWPSRGSIFKGMSGGESEAYVSSEFMINGEKYFAKRKISRDEAGNTKQEAALYHVQDVPDIKSSYKKQIAGPKVGDFDRAIVALCGDYKTALATWFSGQASIGDLVTASEADRRVIFGELQRFQNLQKIADNCVEPARNAKARANALENQIEGAGDPAADLNFRMAVLVDLELDKAHTQGLIDGETQTIDETTEALNEVRASQAKTEAASKERGRLTKEKKAIEAEIERIKDRASKIEGLREDNEQLKGLRKSLPGLEGQAKDYRVAKDNIIREQAKAGNNLLVALGELEELETRVQDTSHPPGPADICASCHFFIESAEVKKQIPVLDRRVIELRNVNNRWVREMEDLPDNPAHQLTEIRSQIEDLSDAPGNLKMAEEALERLAIQEKALQRNAEEALENLKIFVTVKTLDHLKGINPDFEGQIKEISEKLELAKTNRDQDASKLTALATNIGRTTAIIETARANIVSIEEMRTEALELRAKVERLSVLRLAFGPHGLQALLIDQAAPAIEEKAQWVLKQLVDDSMRLRIVTQIPNAKGDTRECFKILVADATCVDWRDVSLLSGGEQRVIRTALRIAIGLWASELSGVRAESLRFDEAFDALDGERADKMMAMMQKLATQYRQIIFITHDPELASRAPARVTLNKRFSDVEVEAA